MDKLTYIREQLKEAHQWLEGTMADVTSEVAHYLPPGAAIPVGAAYAHAIVSEDIVLHTMLQPGGTPLYTSTWADRTGLSVPHPPFSGDSWTTAYTAWTRTVQVDLPSLREYAQAVYAASDQYLASLTPDALDQPMEVPGLGTTTLAYVLGRFLVAHVDQMTGEISAIKGIQGRQGYPF
jgi:hypothetical protein